MLQVTFRIRRDSTQARVSARHPDAKLVIWCNFRTDLYEVHAEKKEVAAAVLKDLRALHGHAAPGASTAVLAPCRARPSRSITVQVELHGGLVLPPIVAENGWETFRMALLDETQFASLYRRIRKMGEVEILRKRKSSQTLLEEVLVPTAELVADLTKKQADMFLTAVHQGYYRHPRGASLKTIAQRAGRPRTTLVEHLRKAEGKLLHALAPFVALHEPHAGPGRPRKDD